MRYTGPGPEAETINYVKYVEDLGVRPLVTLQAEEIARCDGLILPGGGDITPAFFGESNHGSGNIDTGLSRRIWYFRAAFGKQDSANAAA